MNRFKQLNERVVQWADDKGILEKGTPLAQQSKTEEEVAELRESLFAQCNDLEYFKNSKGVICDTSEEVTDAIGDVLVTILIQCKMQNLDALNCLETALNIIEQRSGKMENGIFIKN